MKDGTVAIEMDLQLALAQWPFLTDISLVWAAASVFDPIPTTADTDPSSAAASAVADAILKATELSSWIYFNIITRDSQVFIPLADPVSFPTSLPPSIGPVPAPKHDQFILALEPLR